MLASGSGDSSAGTGRGHRYKPPACHQRLARLNSFSPKAVTAHRSALRLGPELAQEKVGEIKKSAAENDGVEGKV